MKVLMVCLGNICRSPMADGLLRKKVADNKLNVMVDSAGTSAYHVGDAPDHRMIETGKQCGVPIDFLRARQFVKSDFEEFDLIYGMDNQNVRNMLSLATSEEERQKVRLILNEINPTENKDVPDPYYGTMDDFMHVFTLLDEATDRIIEKIGSGEKW